METTRIIGGIAFVAAFFAASLLALWITGCIERSRHGSEAALLSGADSSRMQHLLRNGIPSLKPLSNELLTIRVIGSPSSKTAITRACAKNFRAPYRR